MMKPIYVVRKHRSHINGKSYNLSIRKDRLVAQCKRLEKELCQKRRPDERTEVNDKIRQNS